MNWERLLIILTFVTCATGFTWVALKVQNEQRELEECRRTNIAPPAPIESEQYVWRVYCQALEGQLDTVDLATYSNTADIAIVEVNDTKYLATIEADNHITYVKPNISRIVEAVLIHSR